MHSQPTDKHSKPISEGDSMGLKTQTGEVEAEVQKIILTAPEANREGVENPPKVILKDQHGNLIEHKPEDLEHRDVDKEYQSSKVIGA